LCQGYSERRTNLGAFNRAMIDELFVECLTPSVVDLSVTDEVQSVHHSFSGESINQPINQ